MVFLYSLEGGVGEEIFEPFCPLLATTNVQENSLEMQGGTMPLQPRIFPIKSKKHFDTEHNLLMAKVIYSNGEILNIPYLDYLGEKRLKRKLRHNEMVVDIDNNQKYIFVCQYSPLSVWQQYIHIKCLCPICQSVFYRRLHRVIKMLRQDLSPFCCGSCKAIFNHLNNEQKLFIRKKMTSFRFIEEALDIKTYASNEDPYVKYKLSHKRKISP